MLLNNLANKVKGVKEYSISTLPPGYVKGLIDKHDNIPEQSRIGTYSGYVHVSSLSGNFCAREYAIAQHEDLSLFESFTGGHKVTFRIGRAVEDHIRTSIIAEHGKPKIFAKWTCECGKQSRLGLYKEVQCECGKLLDVFDEPAITDEANGVSGRPDLVLYKDKTLHIVEIKSMKKDQWDTLEAPLDSHIKQNIFYPYLLDMYNFPVSPIVTFIYCTKDFKYGSPYKEFRIDTSEAKYVNMRNELLAEAKQVREFLKNGVSPPRICQSEQSPLAKKCKVAFRCFNIYRDDIK